MLPRFPSSSETNRNPKNVQLIITKEFLGGQDRLRLYCEYIIYV